MMWNNYREFSDFLLDRPEFADEYSRLYNTLNEMQKVTGRKRLKHQKL